MRVVIEVKRREICVLQKLFHGQKINAVAEQRLNQFIEATVIEKKSAVAVADAAGFGQQQNRHAARAGERDAFGGVFFDARVPFTARGRVCGGQRLVARVVDAGQFADFGRESISNKFAPS